VELKSNALICHVRRLVVVSEIVGSSEYIKGQEFGMILDP
jgi:hypothetical protein